MMSQQGAFSSLHSEKIRNNEIGPAKMKDHSRKRKDNVVIYDTVYSAGNLIPGNKCYFDPSQG
jgi:hypothetical protein